MHLPPEQRQQDDSGHPRVRIKRADIQYRKLAIGIGAIISMFWLFVLFQAGASTRKKLLLFLVIVIAFYYCFAHLMIGSYNRDKRKLNDNGSHDPQ